MPATSTAQEPSTPKRDRLLDTAFRLFYRDGFHAVGIDTILAEAKLAKMTLYHHFASKEELIVAALDRRRKQVHAARLAAIAKAGNSPRKRFLAVFDAYAAWFASRDFNGCAFIRAAAEYTDIRSPVHQAVIRQKQELIDTLEELLAALDVSSPGDLAQQVYLLLEGSIVRAHTFGDAGAATPARDAALALLAARRK